MWGLGLGLECGLRSGVYGLVGLGLGSECVSEVWVWVWSVIWGLGSGSGSGVCWLCVWVWVWGLLGLGSGVWGLGLRSAASGSGSGSGVCWIIRMTSHAVAQVKVCLESIDLCARRRGVCGARWLCDQCNPDVVNANRDAAIERLTTEFTELA